MRLCVVSEPNYLDRMTAKSSNTLTSLQCRMARVGLRWSVLDLASIAHVGHSTINRFENEQTRSNASTRAALRRAFEEAGVEFIEDWGVGIRSLPEVTKTKESKKKSS